MEMENSVLVRKRMPYSSIYLLSLFNFSAICLHFIVHPVYFSAIFNLGAREFVFSIDTEKWISRKFPLLYAYTVTPVLKSVTYLLVQVV